MDEKKGFIKDLDQKLSKRPRTNIGIQGDHVSAYALIKTAVTLVIKEIEELKEVSKYLYQILSEVSENSSEDVEVEKIRNRIALFSQQTYYITEEDEEKFMTIKSDEPFFTELRKKLMGAAKRSNQLYKEDLVSLIAKTYVESRNRVTYASFPSEGNVAPPKGEGARVRKALGKLSSIYLKLRKSKSIDLDIATKREIANHMFHLFWYPKIQEAKLIPVEKWKGKEWEETREKYNDGTLPRDNSEKNLITVMANHINLLFTCFPLFLYARKAIIDSFIFKVACNGKIKVGGKGKSKEIVCHWGMKKDETLSLKEKVLSLLPTYQREWSGDLALDSGSGSSRETPDEGQSTRSSSYPLRSREINLPSSSSSSDSSSSSQSSSSKKSSKQDSDMDTGSEGDYEPSYQVTS